MPPQKIKLIWDFRGPMAEGTAKHHAIHLDEFAQKEQLSFFESGTEIINEMYAIAFMVVEEEDMIVVRDALKPHRGELAET